MFGKNKNNNSTFIIAELSANHNNYYELAVKSIEAMAKAGADAVKIQTYKPKSLTIDLALVTLPELKVMKVIHPETL